MRLALIVDDSKTARLLLKKMLAKHDISVAMAESGEEALDYLKDNSPDVIFMDHMMPGMDGFDAVKAIKADPHKSSIPIIMHTTKQGDIYLGQARALGAEDILTKPASARDLQRVLDQIAFDGLAVDNGESLSQPATEAVAKVQPSSVNPSAAEAVSTPIVINAPSSVEPSFFGTPRQWLLMLVWLVPVLWLLSLYIHDQSEIKQLHQQQDNTFEAIEVLMNLQQNYDYGEAPMGGGRLALLEAVLPLLEQSGFTGAVRVEGHTGDFCLSQIPLADGTEVMMLPPPELPLTDCDVIGVSSARAMRLSIEQSPGFTALRQQYQSGAIRIEVAAFGATMPEYRYPVDLEGVTTGDWNAVALDNNRVNYVLIPD